MNTRASVIVALALVLSAAIYSASNWISRERYKFAVVEYERNVNGKPLEGNHSFERIPALEEFGNTHLKPISRKARNHNCLKNGEN